MDTKNLSTKIALVEQSTKTIMEQFNEFKKENIEQHRENMEQHQSISDAIIQIKSSIDLLPERLDKRYASKETEIVLKKILWIVISTIIVSILALVIKE